LLHALIKDTETTVYCLVRAVDEEQAHERIQRTLKAFGLLEALEPFHVDERVVAIPGDLSKPLLGLEQDTFKMLATEVDAIIHNGAEVNLVKPYSSLKSANVLGTQEVLRLAVTNGLAKTRVKPVHYISTNGVFPSSFAAPTFLETANLKEISEHLENGYAQSKWVAEQMCDEAAQRGLPVSILRPGNMAPSSTSGEWNTSDFIYLLLKGCWEIGAVPSRPDWRFDMTPVDFAARAIVHFAALHPVTSLGQTLHIQNAAPPVAGDVFFQLLTRAASAKGKSIEVVADYVAWKQRLEAYQSASRDVEKLVAGLAAFESYFASDKVFDSARATELLSAADIACPAISAELLATYVTKW
jgi:thioester reductase-like protein